MNVYGKRGFLIRVLYLIGAVFRYVMTLGGQLSRGNVVVLCYHGISKEQKERFRWQMSKIIGKALVIINRERQQSPQQFSRKLCITFDDAFENLLENALPLLNELCIPTIVFAVPDNLGHAPKWKITADHPEYKEKIMTAQQLKNIQGDLIKIGSHTQTHPDLSKLSGEEVRWELTESKRNLEELLGKPVEDLALPHGAYNADVLHIAQKVGYKRIYTLEPKLNRYDEDGGIIGRFSMSPDVWPIEFFLTCHGAYSWLRIFRRSVRFFRGLAAKECCTSNKSI